MCNPNKTLCFSLSNKIWMLRLPIGKLRKQDVVLQYLSSFFLHWSICSFGLFFLYSLTFVDRCTRYTWVYGLPSLTKDHIVRALIKTKLEFGRLPSRIYTDFDNRILAGTVEKYANERDYQILVAPTGCQQQNGLVKRAWQTITKMCRSYITQ